MTQDNCSHMNYVFSTQGMLLKGCLLDSWTAGRLR